MKLFDKFEAVKFRQENLIFITHDGYLYYIYNPKYKHWRKHRNAGNDHLTVANYDEVTKAELTDAMNGVFPKSENDFMRLCNPSQLCIRDMLGLLREDYARYMSDNDSTEKLFTDYLPLRFKVKKFLNKIGLFNFIRSVIK